MKKSELRQIIQEEVQKIANESKIIKKPITTKKSVKEATEPRFKTSEEEHAYLISTKPKNTFRQLIEISKPMLKRFRELGAERLIDAASRKNDPSKTKELKEEFKSILMNDPIFWNLWSKKWQNPEGLLSNLFHTLYWYHFA